MTVVESVGWVLVHFLWQGAAIAALLRLVLALAAPARPTLRYALGCGALALMLVVPLTTAGRLIETSAGRLAGTSAGRLVETTAGRLTETSAGRLDEREVGSPDPNSNPLPWGEGRVRGILIRTRVTAMLPWLVGAWAIGVMLLSVRLAGGWWRTRTLRTRGIEAVPEAYQRMIARLIARMRITRPVAFFVSSRVTAPIVFGHVKPVVLVPAAVLAGLSPSQLDAILAHELAHVRRHDYLVNLLQTVIETIFFYHPAVWWVSRQVRQAREECCDDIAVAACGDRKDYVEALLGLEQMRHAAATVALGATDGSLLARARRLLIDTERDAASPRLTASAIAIAVAGIAMAGISMAATEPRIAQQESQRARQAQAVIAAPDPAAPFAERRAWAEREAKARRAERYWFGYSIRPVKGLHPILYFDRETSVIGNGVRLSGHFFSDRAEKLRFPGQPLAIADADPAAIKVLLLFETRGGSARLSRVHASTLTLPFVANDRPIFWIGGADTASSLASIDGLYADASTQDLKKDLVAVAGIHDDSPAVVAWLEQRVGGSDPDEVRAEAVEKLAWHPIPASLAALERAARQDRASHVRRESAEALGDIKMPEAAPVLIALAKSLDDLDARREAIEALGERPEMTARASLIEIARTDASEDLRAEATESLADVKQASAEIVQVLKQIAMSDQTLHVRGEAIEALGELADGKGLDALVEIAREHTDHDTRKKALEALADSEHPKARQIFERILQKPSGE